MLNDFASLKCSKQCEHNVQRPNYNSLEKKFNLPFLQRQNEADGDCNRVQ